MKKYHNFQFGGHNNSPSETQILPIEVSNSKVFTKYKLATLFMVFALFFYFIDFNRAEAQCGGNCNSTAWNYNTEDEQIYMHIDGGCDVLISYRYRECTVAFPPPSTTKRDIQITSMKMSAGCAGFSEEDIMSEANKRLLWHVRSIFGISGASFDVTLITPNCWKEETISDILRLNPCDSTYCCKTNYTIEATDYNYEVTNSTTFPATDSTCSAGVGGSCGEYICNSQFITPNTPLWDANEYSCGSECTNEWSMENDRYVQFNYLGCTYRGYYTTRFCDGVLEVAILKITVVGNCSTPQATKFLLQLTMRRILSYIKNNYTPVPNTRFITKSCWTSAGSVRYPCTFDNCCVGEYEYNETYSKFDLISTSTDGCDPVQTGCESICNSFYDDEIVVFKKSENVENTELIVKLYPNPFIEQLNVDINSTTAESINIDIVDILGNKITNLQSKLSIGNNSIKVNTSNIIANKVYFINVYNQNMELIYNEKINK